MPWCFPGRARSVAWRGRAARSAASCRRELLEQSAWAAASACPRCALSVGPFADLHGGCAACRDRSLGFDAALALGPYDGEIRDLCLRLKHEQNAWLAPWLSDLFVEARREAITTCRRMPGSYRSRCTGGGTGGEVTTRPKRWPAAWRDGLTCRSTSRCGGLSRQTGSPTRGRPSGPKSCTGCSAPGPVVNWLAARCSWSTTS